MMNLEVLRYSPGIESTLGLLFDISNGRRFLCFTLEDPMREGPKIPGKTAIANKTYELTLRTEGKFHDTYSKPDHWAYKFHKGMLWVRDVPDFKWILIHTGNRDEHTKGCLLVGDTAVQNLTDEGEIQSSRNAYRRIYPPIAAALLEGTKVAITYRSAA